MSMGFRHLDFNEILWIKFNGNFMQEANFELKVGEFPRISGTLCFNILIEQLSEEDLAKVKEIIDKEIVNRCEIIEPTKVKMYIGNKLVSEDYLVAKKNT